LGHPSKENLINEREPCVKGGLNGAWVAADAINWWGSASVLTGGDSWEGERIFTTSLLCPKKGGGRKSWGGRSRRKRITGGISTKQHLVAGCAD